MIKRFVFVILALLFFTTFINTAYLQSNSNINSTVDTSVSDEANKSVIQPVTENPRIKTIKDGLKTIAEGSKELSGWCLLIIAASIAVIVKTSNLSPEDKRVRSTYWLFLVGWIFLAISMYKGNLVARRYMAATLSSNLENLKEIGSSVMVDFASQLSMFQIGLMFYAIWLFIYLTWWIYWYEPQKEK